MNVPRLAAKLDNNKIDHNTLEWIIPSWQAIQQNSDLKKQKTIQNLNIAAYNLASTYSPKHEKELTQLVKRTFKLMNKLRKKVC